MAAAGLAGPMGAAKTSVAGLNVELAKIAAGSSTAARGLADLGPKAQDLAKAIAGIGSSRSADQTLADMNPGLATRKLARTRRFGAQ